MEDKISTEKLFDLVGISEEDIRNEAETLEIKLTDEDIHRIGNALSDDEELFAARQEAIGRALEEFE